MPRERSEAELKLEPFVVGSQTILFSFVRSIFSLYGNGRPNRVSWRMTPDIATRTKFRYAGLNYPSRFFRERCTNIYEFFFYIHIRFII